MTPMSLQDHPLAAAAGGVAQHHVLAALALAERADRIAVDAGDLQPGRGLAMGKAASLGPARCWAATRAIWQSGATRSETRPSSSRHSPTATRANAGWTRVVAEVGHRAPPVPGRLRVSAKAEGATRLRAPGAVGMPRVGALGAEGLGTRRPKRHRRDPFPSGWKGTRCFPDRAPTRFGPGPGEGQGTTARSGGDCEAPSAAPPRVAAAQSSWRPIRNRSGRPSGVSRRSCPCRSAWR